MKSFTKEQYLKAAELAEKQNPLSRSAERFRKMARIKEKLAAKPTTSEGRPTDKQQD